jgi:hypothetical protein
MVYKQAWSIKKYRYVWDVSLPHRSCAKFVVIKVVGVDRWRIIVLRPQKTSVLEHQPSPNMRTVHTCVYMNKHKNKSKSFKIRETRTHDMLFIVHIAWVGIGAGVPYSDIGILPLPHYPMKTHKLIKHKKQEPILGQETGVHHTSKPAIGGRADRRKGA